MKRKGFTLIELLAVIIILGIIMVIVVPSVMKTIETSRQKSLLNSTYGLMRAVDIIQKEQVFEHGIKKLEFQYNNGVETSNISGLKLDYTGKKPKSGEIIIDKNGNISFAIYDGKYCAEKSIYSEGVKLDKKEENDCFIINYSLAVKYGGSDYDSFGGVASTNDGYVVVGNSRSADGDLKGLNKGAEDAIIVKYNLDGNVLWKKNFGGSQTDRFIDVIVTNDGYVAVGESYSNDGDLIGLNHTPNDAIIVKYDLNGNVLWKKNFGGNSYESFYKVVLVDDGYVVVGESSSTNGDLTGLNKGWQDGIIVKYNFDGSIAWNKNFGGTGSDSFKSINVISDGFIVVGESSSNDGNLSGMRKGGSDAIIVKYNLSGELLWNYNFGGSEGDQFRDVTVTDDGYVAVGVTWSSDIDLNGLNTGGTDGIIVKYNFAGEVIWKRNFGGSEYDFFDDIIQLKNGYLVTGDYGSNDGDFPGLDNLGNTIAISYDYNGNVLFKKRYGGEHGREQFNNIISVNDEAVVVGEGYSDDFFGDYYNYSKGCEEPFAFMIKLDSNGEALLPPVGKIIGHVECGEIN